MEDLNGEYFKILLITSREGRIGRGGRGGNETKL